MTTALITTCDRCAKQLGSKPAPPKPTTMQIASFSGGSITPQPKQYDFCHTCSADFLEWLSGSDA